MHNLLVGSIRRGVSFALTTRGLGSPCKVALEVASYRVRVPLSFSGMILWFEFALRSATTFFSAEFPLSINAFSMRILIEDLFSFHYRYDAV